MVGTSVVVLTDAICDRVHVAPGDDRIDKAITSSTIKVLVTEAESAEVLRVNGQSEI